MPKRRAVRSRRDQSNPPQHPAKRYRLLRLEQTVGAWLHRLAEVKNETDRQAFIAGITAYRANTLAMLARRGAAPADLPAEQQRIFARTLLWSEEPWITIMPRAALAFEAALRRAASSGQVRYLPHEGCLWRVARRGERLRIAISDVFLLDAAGEVPERLARFLVSGSRRTQSTLRETRFLKQWMGSEQALQYFFALERHIDLSRQAPVGAAHDLRAIYLAVNEEYFSGSLMPSELRWSPRAARCRTGYYNPMDNSITISRVLDAPDVPEFVVAFVVYHEMLHQQARLALLRGEGRSHDKAFREAERKFAHYAKAAAWLDRLAKGKAISPG